TVVLELYFANEEKTALISEKRMLDIKDNETAEKTAIGELMKGPAAKGVKLITEDIKVLSIETKDKFCYVNLSKEFLSLPAENSDLCIYSIVNTLTRLPEISSVQFLVEGEKAEKIGDTVMSEPFTYNEDLVD
ncbi:MAG: GerMN domain-containing protein, partial [Clostridia bacterium]|nr:GerMN domain-containing protein [Clostridia bacterium]